MVQILNGIRNPEGQPFEIQTNGSHFVKKIKTEKAPVFDWSRFQIVGTIAIAVAKA